MTVFAKPPTTDQLIADAFDRLASRLPGSWRLFLQDEPQARPGRPDAVFELRGPGGERSALIVEVKQLVGSRQVQDLLRQLRDLQRSASLFVADERAPMLVARYLPPAVRETLARARISYADATGNLRVEIEQPAVFIETEGASSDPWRGPDRVLSTLRGRPAARVVRALIDFVPPVGIRELAQRAETSLGSTYRAADFLSREAIIEREESGAIVGVDWPRLIERWADDYALLKANTVGRCIAPRGLPEVLGRLGEADFRYAITGSFAAATVAEYAESRLLAVFVDDIVQAGDALNLRMTESAPNVFLIRPFDGVVYQRQRNVDGLEYAAPSQVAADLMGSPGRGPAEATALIDWMKANENEWRR